MYLEGKANTRVIWFAESWMRVIFIQLLGTVEFNILKLDVGEKSLIGIPIGSLEAVSLSISSSDFSFSLELFLCLSLLSMLLNKVAEPLIFWIHHDVIHSRLVLEEGYQLTFNLRLNDTVALDRSDQWTSPNHLFRQCNTVRWEEHHRAEHI